MNEQINEKLIDFFKQYEYIEIPPKKVLIRPTDSINYIYFILEGEVKQYLNTINGHEIILHMFTKGAYLPIMIVLAGTSNKYYFESCTKIRAYKAPVSAVLEFVQEDPEVCFDLLKKLSTGLAKLLLKTEGILYQDAYARVLTMLVYFAKKYGKEDGDMTNISIPLTHSDIASWTGIQRETASRQLEHLADSRIISYEKQNISVDMDKLLLEEKEYKYFLARK